MQSSSSHLVEFRQQINALKFCNYWAQGRGEEGISHKNHEKSNNLTNVHNEIKFFVRCELRWNLRSEITLYFKCNVSITCPTQLSAQSSSAVPAAEALRLL